MKTIRLVNIENFEASTAKEYVAYLKEADVWTDIRLKPGTTANNTLTFYYPNGHLNKSIIRIKNAMVEIFDDWDEQNLQKIFNKLDELKESETITWDNSIGNFVD
jgi:predicted nuclease of restriction endonuclease-like RecB superfamily